MEAEWGGGGVLTHLLQVGTHALARPLGIVILYRLEDALVMVLAALSAAFGQKRAHALLPKQADNRIYQRQDERIASRFRQGEVKVQIGLDESIPVLPEASITVTASRMLARCGSSAR